MGYTITTLPTRYVKKGVIESTMLWQCGSVELPNGAYRVLYRQTVDLTNQEKLCYTANVSGANDVSVQIKFGTTTVDTSTLGNGDRHFKEIDISGQTGEDTLLIQAYCSGAVQPTLDLAFWLRAT